MMQWMVHWPPQNLEHLDAERPFARLLTLQYWPVPIVVDFSMMMMMRMMMMMMMKFEFQPVPVAQVGFFDIYHDFRHLQSPNQVPMISAAFVLFYLFLCFFSPLCVNFNVLFCFTLIFFINVIKK